LITEISGKIINDTGLPLKDCALVYNSLQIGFIGDIKPGVNAFQVTFPSGVSSGGIMMSEEWASHYNINQEEEEDKIRKNLSDRVMEDLFTSQKAGLILVGWNSEPYLDIKLNHGTHNEHINLFLCNLLEGDIKNLQ